MLKLKIAATIRLGVILAAAVIALGALRAENPKTATLYSPIKYKDDFSRASFDFNLGRSGTGTSWDLMYGNLYTGNDVDWFQPSMIGDNRHVIRDLGTLDWSDQIRVPLLIPRPKLMPGERRKITVNTSAGAYDNWAANAEHEGIFARAVVGHMYALHAKNSRSDYYILFRVDSIEHGDHCTISWRRVRRPT